MPSLLRRDHCRPSFVAEPPHFIKIIIADTKQIRIPTKFAKMHGDSLSNTLSLRVPNGGIWKVDVVKKDGDLWLQNGWKDFAQYYSLEYRSLLVFRYNGNSNFCVLIFGKTASEIDYPILNIKCEEPDSEEISYRNDLPIQILDGWSMHASPQKRKRINSSSETQNGAYLLPSDSHFATKDTKSNMLKLEKSGRYMDRSSHDLGDNRSIGDRVRKRRMEPKVEPSEFSTDSYLDGCSPRQRQESKVRNKRLMLEDVSIRQRPSSSGTAKPHELPGRSNPSFKCVMHNPL